jgi:hypothetical protein
LIVNSFIADWIGDEMRRPLHVTVLIFAIISTAPAIAQQQNQPWKLTLDERIALRTSTELAAQRVRDSAPVQATSVRPTNPSPRPFVDEFDGKGHPELFLPHEVFDELIKLAFSGSPRVSRMIHDGFNQDVKRIGLPTDFWERLQSLSTIYIADLGDMSNIAAGLRQQTGRARQRTEEIASLKQTDLCRSRADALDAARKAFGRERFDRFLYEVIARNMFYVADRLPYPELLQSAERGCR